MIDGLSTRINPGSKTHSYPGGSASPVAPNSLTLEFSGGEDCLKYLFAVRWEVDGVRVSRCPRCEVVKAGDWDTSSEYFHNTERIRRQ